ncbi:MAG: hypothetical protein JXR41_12540 [Bacteroidales bacterium]|nr:hypothetical protein [Bacteroidales bacterium]MBN2763914.1 hypothetical protein [Bacteroidales bacterium]
MNKTFLYVSFSLNVIMLSAIIVIGSSVFSKKPSEIKEVQHWTEDVSIPDNIIIAMLGDSHIAYANWNDLLGRHDIQNFGVADFTVKQLSWILGNWVIASKPVICFINSGQLDLHLGVPLERIIEDYTMILDSLQNNGVKPIVQSTLPKWNDPEGNKHINRLNKLMTAVCNDKDIDYINLNIVLSDKYGLKPELTTDGTHLNRKGYELWSIMLKDYLLSHSL